jgi:hypothetical protein
LLISEGGETAESMFVAVSETEEEGQQQGFQQEQSWILAWQVRVRKGVAAAES